MSDHSHWDIEGVPEPATAPVGGYTVTVTGMSSTPGCQHVWHYARTQRDWRHPYPVDVFYCEKCLLREERPA